MSGHNDVAIVFDQAPLDLAVLAPNSALKVVGRFPHVESWAIAGYSLGGATAARLVEANPEEFKGLILLAAHPPRSTNLSDWQAKVLNIYASNDGVAEREEILEGLDRLSHTIALSSTDNAEETFANDSTTYLYEIIGGNHANFASYGAQRGDGTPTISREEQHEQITQLMGAFLDATF